MTNPLKLVATGPKASPTDPQECCDWANARMGTSEREWIVTGNKDRPIALFRSVWPKWRP